MAPEKTKTSSSHGDTWRLSRRVALLQRNLAALPIDIAIGIPRMVQAQHRSGSKGHSTW